MVHAGGYSQVGLLRKTPTTAARISDPQRLSRAEGRVGSVIARSVSDQAIRFVQRLLDRFAYARDDEKGRQIHPVRCPRDLVADISQLADLDASDWRGRHQPKEKPQPWADWGSGGCYRLLGSVQSR